MVDIHREALCAAPIDVAFAYLDDYRTTTQWMFGLSRFEPAGELKNGLGAVYDATFAVKPIKLSSTVEITGWARDELIEFESTKGFRNWSTWRFTATSPQQTRITVEFSYELPGGLAGKAMGKAMEPIVALSVRHSEESLRREIEARYRRE